MRMYVWWMSEWIPKMVIFLVAWLDGLNVLVDALDSNRRKAINANQKLGHVCNSHEIFFYIYFIVLYLFIMYRFWNSCTVYKNNKIITMNYKTIKVF